jgi:uncharacterized protein YcaQ
VLPILLGRRFVGRFEPRIDRDGGRVEVLGLSWEDGFSARRVDGFVEAMREALAAYLRFSGMNPWGSETQSSSVVWWFLRSQVRSAC